MASGVRGARAALAVSAAALLCGCWTPPSANVRPGGKPRIVARGIEAEVMADAAKVEAVDRGARAIALTVRGVRLSPCAIGPGVRNWRDIHAGDRVRATIREVLTVSVAPQEAGGLPDARVLAVDPSYRLLTIEYRSGRMETLKVGLHTPMDSIESGDSVAIRPVEVLALRVRQHSHRQMSSHAARGDGPAP